MSNYPDRPSSPAFAVDFWHSEAQRLREELEAVYRELGEAFTYQSDARVQLIRKRIDRALKPPGAGSGGTLPPAIKVGGPGCPKHPHAELLWLKEAWRCEDCAKPGAGREEARDNE